MFIAEQKKFHNVLAFLRLCQFEYSKVFSYLQLQFTLSYLKYLKSKSSVLTICKVIRVEHAYNHR